MASHFQRWLRAVLSSPHELDRDRLLELIEKALAHIEDGEARGAIRAALREEFLRLAEEERELLAEGPQGQGGGARQSDDPE